MHIHQNLYDRAQKFDRTLTSSELSIVQAAYPELVKKCFARWKNAEYKKKEYQRNKEYYQQKGKEYRANNPDYKDKTKKWRQKNPDKVKVLNRKSNLAKIGCTIELYEQMYKEQEGKCKICSIPKDKLCVDHCHETEVIRGLLCENCNHGLGKFMDNTVFLTNAIQYLNGQNNRRGPNKEQV